MLHFLPGPVLGTLTSLLLVLNLVFWIIPFYIISIFKVLVPIQAFRTLCTRLLIGIGEIWIDGNSAVSKLHRIEWVLTGRENLRYDDWYLLSANHQSWADVFVLQHALNRYIPFQRFFIKKQLIWVPLLGLAWWALDMPFMQRHSRKEIEKDPSLRRKDLDVTIASCKKFRDVPSTITNFIEGTRHSPAKHAKQASPYVHLLKPKTGGLAFAIAALGKGTLNTLLNVLIAYPPNRTISFWDLLSGKVQRIEVHVNTIPIPREFHEGDYHDDPEFRTMVQDWVTTFWVEHDKRLGAIIDGSRDATDA